MSNPPSRHHYVPECYLKSFTNKHGQIWVKDKKTGNIKYRTPSQICYEQDLYKIKLTDTLMLNNLKDDNYIEKESFKAQENNFKQVQKGITRFSSSSIVIDKSKYKLLIEFVANIKRRNPFVKSFMIRDMPERLLRVVEDDGFREFMITASREVGEKFDFDGYLAKYKENELKNPDKINDLYLSSFLGQNTLQKITDTLYQYRQFILHAPIGKKFITSDNPGFTKTKDAVVTFGGLGEPFEFYFPLSSSCYLYINSSETEETAVIEKIVYPVFVGNDIVKEINFYTSSLPHKILICQDKSTFHP